LLCSRRALMGTSAVHFDKVGRRSLPHFHLQRGLHFWSDIMCLQPTNCPCDVVASTVRVVFMWPTRKSVGKTLVHSCIGNPNWGHPFAQLYSMAMKRQV